MICRFVMQSLRVSEQGICSNQKPIIGHSHTELKMEKAQCSRTSLVFNFHLRNDLDLLINEKNQIKVIRTYQFYFFHCRSQKKKKKLEKARQIAIMQMLHLSFY